MILPGLGNIFSGTSTVRDTDPVAERIRSNPGQTAGNDSEKGRSSPSADSQLPGGDKVSLSSEAQMLQKLTARDQEVRQHEAAHVAMAGQYAGAPTYTYQRGPDGKAYAVGGEVSLDMDKVSGDPQATLQKAQTIRAAALAPAQPSSQDRQVASRASQMAAQARQEMVQKSTVASGAESESSDEDSAQLFTGDQDSSSSSLSGSAVGPSRSRLDIRA